MINENAQKLVAALRSGEFKQGQDQLRKPGDRYCCLGVACELYLRETGDGAWDEHGVFQPDDEKFYLPERVRSWLGFSTARGYFVGGSLATMNDLGNSFDEIADTIEEEPKALFA